MGGRAGGRMYRSEIAFCVYAGEKWNRSAAIGHRIFIAGAVSDKVFQFLRVQKQTVELIVRDFTRVFAAPESFYAFLRKGGRVQVLHRSRLLAVTINPQSPGGLLLDSLRLQQALEESLQIPVYDVKKIEKVGKNR